MVAGRALQIDVVAKGDIAIAILSLSRVRFNLGANCLPPTLPTQVGSEGLWPHVGLRRRFRSCFLLRFFRPRRGTGGGTPIALNSFGQCAPFLKRTLTQKHV